MCARPDANGKGDVCVAVKGYDGSVGHQSTTKTIESLPSALGARNELETTGGRTCVEFDDDEDDDGDTDDEQACSRNRSKYDVDDG